MPEYHNEIKTIKAKTKEDNPNLALLFEENYNQEKPDWRVISSEKRNYLKQYFDRIVIGDQIEVGFNDKGHIIFLKGIIGQVKQDFSDIKESSLPKANGKDYSEGAAFGLACHLSQMHISWFIQKGSDEKTPDDYFEKYKACVKKYVTLNEEIKKEIKEANATN